MSPLVEPGRHYPLRAKLGLALAAVFFLAELVVLALWMMPMIPLVPVFISTLLGQGFVLASVLEWANAQRTSTTMVKRPLAAEARPRRHAGSTPAHAA